MHIRMMIFASVAALAILPCAASAERDTTYPTQQTGIQPPQPPTDRGEGVYGGPEPDPRGPDGVYGGPEPDPNGPPDRVPAE